MRYLYLLLILFSIVACKKKSYRNFSAGDEKNMIITEINKTIDLRTTELIPRQKIDVNLDGTGIYDASFRCDHALRSQDTSEIIWHLWLTTLNDDFRVHKVGVDSYVSYSEILVDSNPDSPLIEAEKIYSCEPSEGAKSYKTDFFLESFREDEKIDHKNYDWTLTNLFIDNRISIAKKDVEPIVIQDEHDYYDTLIRTNTHHVNNCQNVVIKNERSYFIFKEVSEYENNLGWIEYELTDDQFTIYRIAISDKSLRE